MYTTFNIFKVSNGLTRFDRLIFSVWPDDRQISRTFPHAIVYGSKNNVILIRTR